ncbi:MAG TPA: cytochrome bc complex cytochrome b subunit [Actinomycetota bacterium]|nr:cytochrome bc complex cytochrome b subunit [Actinomycetota bacterium]
MVVRRTVKWVDERAGISGFTHHTLDKVFPDHWSFLFGEIALYAFVVLVATGIFLAMFFNPSLATKVYHGAYAPMRGVRVSAAYGSALDLSFSVRAGLVMRQTHHWAALVFIAAIVVHLCRIFFTGAFRKPREINWWIGLTLMLLALFNGFTGYSLLDDLLSGTGLRIAYSIALSIPFIGTWIAFLLFGGEFPSDQIISRLFFTHVFLVPLLIIGLLSVHLALVWRQKHTQFPGGGRTDRNVHGIRFWPSYATESVGLFFGVAAVLTLLGGLAQINPIWLYGPFHAANVSGPAQPDWYLGWLEGALRIFPSWEIRIHGVVIPNPFFPGVLLPGITFGLLYAWPIVERRFTGDYAAHHLLERPHDRPVRSAIGVTALTFYIVLFLAGANDLMAKWFSVPVETITWVLRIGVIVTPLVTGAVTYWLMNAYKLSGAEQFTKVPLVYFLHPRKPPIPRPHSRAQSG